MGKDLNHIDLVSLIEQKTATRFGSPYGNGEKRTVKGPCPWCQGNDRFAVFINSEPQRFYCGIHGNGCKRQGDAISFLEEWEGKTFVQACIDLEVPLDRSHISTPRPKTYYTNDDKAPGNEWQSVAATFANECKEALWHSKPGENALQWLRQRGLSDDTIKQAGLGYNPQERFDDKAAWAVEHRNDLKGVWIPRGITIPWLYERQLWKLNIRRPNPDLARQAEKWEAQGKPGKPAKYVPLVGSSNGLYGANWFNPELPTVLVEGEFDKLILSQVEPHSINVVATGSTGKGRCERNTLMLAQSPIVLVAFDSDGKGEKAAREYWLKVIQHSKMWLPWQKDINDMYLDDQASVKQWLQLGLDVAGYAPRETPTSLDEMLDNRSSEDEYQCSVCGSRFTDRSAFNPEGVAFCDHNPATGEAFCSRSYERTSLFSLDEYVAQIEATYRQQDRNLQASPKYRQGVA